MVKQEIQRLMALFPESFINRNFELILVPETNLYFLLEDVKTLEDLQFKVIAWCSRAAAKTAPYYAEEHNNDYQKMVRDKINEFLGTDFSKGEWLYIYTVFGNGANEQLCREFVRSDFNYDLVVNA